MSLDFTAEVWDALSTHIDFNDRSEAADTLVNLLIDHNYEADDIKDAFRGNKAVLKALKAYVEEHDTELDDDDDYEEDTDEWN